jgi:DtxR family Mn-dependent transcriptional regulator
MTETPSPLTHGEQTPPATLGEAAQDYLKAIYTLSLAETRVLPSQVAERLGVSPAAVTKMLRRLQELKLVSYERSQELALTAAGMKVALEVVRHHRLLELYLMEALGYTWDQVHPEAERLEHVISEEFEARIDALLGYPTHDPHGDPIPTLDGRVEELRLARLVDLEPGTTGVVRRVTDGDPAMLRYMGSLGLYPDAPVEMLDKAPYGGPLRVRVAGAEHAIGRELAEHVFVAPAAPAPDSEETS